jgi:tRNA A37 methylthiotransferase MiaB
MGRTDTNKLVFFVSEASLIGELVRVKVEHTGPWSMRGALVSESQQQDLVSIPVLN